MRIQTHYAPHCKDSPWMALDMDRACELLEGYGLTDEERSQIPELMMGYCRLIDEAGLIGYGMTAEEAEIAAIEASERSRKEDA